MKITPRKALKKAAEEPEQNVEMQAARGRLKGLLHNIIDEPEASEAPKLPKPKMGRPRRVVESGSPKPYVIKLFDRMVNVSEFDENTPLYPITRAWFYDRKNELPNVKKASSADAQPTYYKGRESLVKQLRMGRIDRVAALPPPSEEEDVQRIPYCEPPAMENGLNLFTVDYDWENPIVATEDLTVSYLERWRKVRSAWNLQAVHYSQRYEESRKILEQIAKRA